MKTDEKIREQFKEASAQKDLDKMQDLLLSAGGDEEEFHREIWKSATDYCSKKETTEAFRHFRRKLEAEHGRKWTVPATLFAAAACCLLAVNIWISGNGQPAAPETDWTECMAHNCEMRELLLPDSTHVWLNAKSRIIYPESFIGKERKVFIDGEAFFEVKKDSLHPFIVQCGENKVKVTGTRFNLKTYDDQFTATLVEGGIHVLLFGNEYIMTPGEVLTADCQTGTVHMAGISSSKFPRWYQGEINIYNEPLRVIADDLERKFGVEIIIRNKALAEERFTVSFVNHEGLDEILDAMSIVNSMKIIRKDNIIDIL